MNHKQNRCIIGGVALAALPFEYNEDSTECQNVKLSLLNAIVLLHNHKGVDEFYTDCGFGFPLWGGEIVTGLMKYNDIDLYVVFPHENQAYRYATDWQDRYYKVHELCTEVIPTFTEYDVDGNRIVTEDDENTLERKATDYMLSDCGRLLFCGDGRGHYLYEEAARLGLEITTLNLVRRGTNQ
jgi:uncharacterized phage-like protein YoqJ